MSCCIESLYFVALTHAQANNGFQDKQDDDTRHDRPTRHSDDTDCLCRKLHTNINAANTRRERTNRCDEWDEQSPENSANTVNREDIKRVINVQLVSNNNDCSVTNNRCK